MDTTDKFSSSKEVINFLAETFPNCFSVKGNAKPLKIGIFQDIVEQIKDDQRLSKTLLRSSLRHYTNSWRYLHCVKEGVCRVDLNGVDGDKIEKEHADHAAEQLKQSKEKAAEKRKEQGSKLGSKENAPRKKRASVPAKGTKPIEKRTKKPTPVKLESSDLKAGTLVTVKLGKIPMNAVITEIAKDGVHVQLDSGMIMKVDSSNLRLAPSKR
ncbi:RNA chaperone ProQ [Alteromonas sp. 5E99-2]|uniref:RNA chaperone ProQ n=1 Tax=Alteromonas sp. 5E99-2 TaxID=2817683 RepID=UPI001A98DD8A|nr:RNA chaperone ProQ [Alteromonas sp. 5E99-2]MBO1255038.1 RNA chaperone ProQ [Alteromonas sp. 5E99-2]